MVEEDHLEVVDLGPSPARPRTERGIRFASPDFSPDQVEAKIAVCNQVLAIVRQALTSRGLVALPLLQGLLQEVDTELLERLPGLRLDVKAQILPETVFASLGHRPNSEHRRRVEFGLLDLMERALDLCTEHLDEQGMDHLLSRVSGFHQRIRS